jgi:hypothetical protein
MKKILTVTALLFFSFTQIKACDICGSGVSNYNPYLFPHLSKAYLGFSYYLRQYHSVKADGSINKEFNNSVMLTGQYSVGKRLHVILIIPYHSNHLRSTYGIEKLNGIGDITLMANYKIWDHKLNTQSHILTGGIGVKLCTGKYNPVSNTEKEQQNFQLGTGSMDYLLNASYRYSARKWVFAGTTSYKYNTQNSDDFRYGDIWTNELTAIYRSDLKKVSMLPFISLKGEHYMKDANKHILQGHSGGNVVLAGVGLDMNTRKIAVGLEYMRPLSQTLAGGEIEAKPRLSAHLALMF